MKAAGLVSGATALSRVLGLVREQVMAYFFGAGMATDAFVAAFRIPNLLRDMFAEGALSAAFVPIFKEKMVKESAEEAFSLAHVVITAVLVIVGLIVLLGIVAAPAIVYLMAHGFTDSPAKFDLTVGMTRVMMVYLLLVSLSAMIMGMLNSFGRFGIPALSPALFNLGTVLTVVCFYNVFEQPIYTLAIGVVVGGVGQVAVQLPSLLRIGYRFRFCFSFLDEGLKKIVRLLVPMMAGLSASRVNILVSTLLASFLMEGAMSYLNYAYRLMHFPLGVFAVALGTVALPKASELVARGEQDKLGPAFEEAMGTNLFVVIPSAVFLALMGHEVIELIFQWGAFSAVSTERTALALLHFSYGLIGFAAVRVTVPFFYAVQDSRRPMKASIVAVVVNLALYYPMIRLLDFAGLAAATSVAGFVNILLLLRWLPSTGVRVSMAHLGLKAFRILVASTAAFHIARLLPYSFVFDPTTVLGRIVQLVVPLVAAGLLYLLFCFILRVKEVRLLKRLIMR